MAFQVRAEEAKAQEQDSPKKEDGKYDASTIRYKIDCFQMIFRKCACFCFKLKQRKQKQHQMAICLFAGVI